MIRAMDRFDETCDALLDLAWIMKTGFQIGVLFTWRWYRHARFGEPGPVLPG